MLFHETKLKGVFIIELEPLEDERGFFARLFCQEEFKAHGINFQIVQCNISFNKKKGTLRGMHYQIAPYQEAKLVRCTMGAIYDVIIDLRPDSPTYNQWIAVLLTASNENPETFQKLLPAPCLPLPAHSSQLTAHTSHLTAPGSLLYIPEGFAHGFQTLVDNTELFYMMSEFYHPECARGMRWDDPTFQIEWPMPPSVISEKDKNYSDFQSFAHEFQEKTVKLFHSMKFEFTKHPNEVMVPIYHNGEYIACLRPIHINFTDEEIKLLVKWRNKNREAFFTWINATEQGTKEWLINQVLNRHDRILFFVETTDGIPFGHIGITNVDFSCGSFEIDNVLRGEKGVIEGGMSFALKTLLNWMFFTLNAKSAFLRVFSDNKRAINFYIKNGFHVIKKVAMKQEKEGNVIRWVESQEETECKKWVVYMKVENE